MGRRWFWPLIAFGSLLELLGGLSLGVSLGLERASSGDAETSEAWTNYGPLAKSDYGDPLPWLVAGVILVVLGFVPNVAAARRRELT